MRITLDGKLSGKGKYEVVQDYQQSPGINTIKPIMGEGDFQVTGSYTEGQGIIFSFVGSEIICKGKVMIKTPGGNIENDLELTFDPESVTPNRQIIERKDGATAEMDISLNLVNLNGRGKSEFQLTFQKNLLQLPKQSTEENPTKDTVNEDIWTLEVEMFATSNYQTPQITMTSSDHLQGSAIFFRPEGDGKAQGEGPLSYITKANITGEISNQSTTECNGKLILNGYIEDDVLTFIPEASVTAGQHSQNNFKASHKNYSGFEFFNTEEEVYIPVKDGAEVIQDISKNYNGMAYQGKLTWSLKGKEIEKWRVTIDGWDINFTGDNQLACGLKVHWRNIIIVKIENGQYRSGAGKALLVDIEPYSHPPEVYKSTSISVNINTKTGGTLTTPFVNNENYNVQGSLNGKEITLDQYFPANDVNGYGVSYHSILNHQQGEAKVINWNLKKDDLREVIEDYHYIPFPYRIKAMLIDGWSKEEGNPSSINYQKITMGKIN